MSCSSSEVVNDVCSVRTARCLVQIANLDQVQINRWLILTNHCGCRRVKTMLDLYNGFFMASRPIMLWGTANRIPLPYLLVLGGIQKLRWQDEVGRWLFKCQRYLISLVLSNHVNQRWVGGQNWAKNGQRSFWIPPYQNQRKQHRLSKE